MGAVSWASRTVGFRYRHDRTRADFLQFLERLVKRHGLEYSGERTISGRCNVGELDRAASRCYWTPEQRRELRRKGLCRIPPATRRRLARFAWALWRVYRSKNRRLWLEVEIARANSIPSLGAWTWMEPRHPNFVGAWIMVSGRSKRNADAIAEAFRRYESRVFFQPTRCWSCGVRYGSKPPRRGDGSVSAQCFECRP